MKPIRRHITMREREMLKRHDSVRKQRNARLRGALLERDRLKVLLLDDDLSPRARADIEAALAIAQANLDALCKDPHTPINLLVEKNAELGKRSGDRVDGKADDDEPPADQDAGETSDAEDNDSAPGLTEADDVGGNELTPDPVIVPLTKRHKGGGRWFVMRGEEEVSGPHKKDVIDAELATAQAAASA